MPGRRVLIVEDTDLLRRMYHDRLVQDGYEVLDAADGLAALSVLRDQPIDLILLDLIMPRMGGLQVLEAVKADPRTKDIPVVILTNLGEESAIEQAVSLGATDYLIKNQSRPADVSEKVTLTLEAFGAGSTGADAFHVFLRPETGDVGPLVDDVGLKRMLWCPACENELALRLVPDSGHPGHYDAYFVCNTCGREFAGLR
ncbi:MAG TPA: response regulator [Actinobacteria bacterium]|nr:response regulator [Actinomycetota bacterium]